MPRLFTGLTLPASIQDQLCLMKGGIASARWIEPDDLHLTLRFFGDMDPASASELASALDHIRPAPFTLRLGDLGFFGGKSPRMVWIGAHPSEPLSALQQAHEMLAQRLGYPPEKRKYTPHVTLARLRGGPVETVMSYISQHNLSSHKNILQDGEVDELQGTDLLSFEVSSFALFSAKSSTGGGPYVIEERYDF